MRAGPSPDPPTSFPFDSPSIKRGPHDPPCIQLEIKITPCRRARRFPTLSRAFIIIEFRDMLIKSRPNRQAGQAQSGWPFLSLPLSHARSLSSSSARIIRDRCYFRAAAQSLHTRQRSSTRHRSRSYDSRFLVSSVLRVRRNARLTEPMETRSRYSARNILSTSFPSTSIPNIYYRAELFILIISDYVISVISQCFLLAKLKSA